MKPSSLLSLVGALALALHAAEAPAQSLTFVRNTVVSSNATAIKSYETNVNVASYRHQGLLYYSGYQYVAWFNGNTRNLIVGRRAFDPSSIGTGSWRWGCRGRDVGRGGCVCVREHHG